jgi:5'-AMP-activated protein kinase catalytic alpha subunit
MQRMEHVNIAQLFDVIETTKQVFLIMEYVGNGSLHGYLKQQANRRLSEEEAKRIYLQIL